MTNTRELAMQIWQSGVQAVRAEQLICQHVRCDLESLVLCDSNVMLEPIGRICVVGAGKAAGYLAEALVDALRPIAEQKRLHGLVNVPDNCVLALDYVELHAARPAGVNEPRPEGVAGTQRILNMVSDLRPIDLCICLITGGGSALLPAPKAPTTLEDKLQVTKLLSSRGASIQDLNRVRIALSDVKGGGLRERCGANRLITLIVSDIIGDPVELIASGPTVRMRDVDSQPSEVLRRYVDENEVSDEVWATLNDVQSSSSLMAEQSSECHVLANNQAAVDAARKMAESHGIRTIVLPAEAPNTTAESVATSIIDRLATPIDAPLCILWGGEPVVHLNAAPGRGGRNQQLVLSAMCQWESIAAENRDRACILSGGTDGEDGPTDAAGAMVDAELVQAAYNLGLNAQDYLRRNDAYPFFQKIGGLITTGPTHTNVCDLRVVLVM